MSKIEIFESDRAAGYNQFTDTWIPNYRYFLDQLPRILRDVQNKTLLAVGCGTGNEIERFMNAPETWNITGVDPSPEMLKQARDKFHNLDNVTLIDGVITAVGADKKFGAATLLLVLHFLEETEKLSLLKAIAERLASGGSFVMFDITGDGDSFTQNVKTLQRLWPDGVDAQQAENRVHRIRHELHHISEETLINLYEEAGFHKPVRFFQSAVYMGWLAKKK